MTGDGKPLMVAVLGAVAACLIALIGIAAALVPSIPLPVVLLPVPPVPGPLPNGAVAPLPIGSPGAWFGDDAYPADAIRRGAQGRTVAGLTIDAWGRVRDCRIETGSGNASLDRATCDIVRDRGRFRPARVRDEPVAATYPLRVRWVLPASGAGS